MTKIIAEISGNHGGDLEKACDLIIAAARCGCDAVKFQLYVPEDLNDPPNNADYEKYHVPGSWLPLMFDKAALCGVPLFASVFAPWAVELLDVYRPFAYKIASPESTRLPERTYRELAAVIRRTGAELFVSAGVDWPMMARLNPDVLFYCKAGYPATLKDSDLYLMRRLRGGFSDHTADVASPLAMIAAGATHIEKHFKLDDRWCVDAAFSLDPEQMKLLCDLAHRSS